MELLASTVAPRPDIPDFIDNAFMTGLFSLLDVLINLPMPEILKELPLHDAVNEALRVLIKITRRKPSTRKSKSKLA